MRSSHPRLKRLLAIVALSGVVATLASLLALELTVGIGSIHMAIATGIAVFGSVMVGGGLMALLFMSAGTGHDAAVHHFEKEDEDR